MSDDVLPVDAFQAALTIWPLPRPELPWRCVSDPWALLCAEVMLQQTPVSRVEPRFGDWRGRYPTPVSLACAPLREVLEWWSGMGYPRRAANLHRAAQQLVGEHGGHVPDDLPALLALAGVGRYTARAVLSFAFNRRVGVLDTNVGRVLARVAGETLTHSRAQELADLLVPEQAPGLWNQKLLDLGATVCRARPLCAECPAAPVCGWNLAGRPEPDPSRRSAGVSRPQPAYLGSDRELRGLLLRVFAAAQSPLSGSELSESVARSRRGWTPERVAACLRSLVDDGLVSTDGEGGFVLGDGLSMSAARSD